jgi:co-chaperonin GroES (HSP10)
VHIEIQREIQKGAVRYLEDKVMIIKMRNGNIALEELASDERTSGGIYIPTTAARIGTLRHGRVVEVGPGELVQGQFVAVDFEKGQEVIFDVSRSETIEVDGKKLTICNMVDIIATVSAKHLSVVPTAPIPNETA